MHTLHEMLPLEHLRDFFEKVIEASISYITDIHNLDQGEEIPVVPQRAPGGMRHGSVDVYHPLQHTNSEVLFNIERGCCVETEEPSSDQTYPMLLTTKNLERVFRPEPSLPPSPLILRTDD